jgi:hypothetical protein
MASATYVTRNGTLVEIDVVDGAVVEVPARVRCPECGEIVAGFFDHLADGCPDDPL